MEHSPRSTGAPLAARSDPDDLQRIVTDGLVALGCRAAALEIERLERLARLLERWSERINLTGHRGARAIAERLLLEAAALSQALPPASRIVDIGSGAGIPGLPLAICRPEAEIWLVEARERRHHFQRAAIRELGLPNAHPLRGRAEDLEPVLADGVVSQAFARPSEALAPMRRWLGPNGWIALATTPDPASEPWSHPDLTPGEWLAYAAPTGPRRAVWVARLRGERQPTT